MAAIDVDSWQHKVLQASQYVMSSSSKDDNDDYSSAESAEYYSFYDNNIDNTSNRCATWLDEVSTDCSCEPRVLLRWARILFYKVARTYMAAPLLLALLPLCVGLLIGIVAGKQWERKQDKSKNIAKCKERCFSGLSEWTFWLVNAVHSSIWQVETLETKENRVRADLKSDANTQRESGVDLENVPKHVAVIMDGNRRYGKARYGNVAKVSPIM